MPTLSVFCSWFFFGLAIATSSKEDDSVRGMKIWGWIRGTQNPKDPGGLGSVSPAKIVIILEIPPLCASLGREKAATDL